MIRVSQELRFAAERERENLIRLTCDLIAVRTENPPGRNLSAAVSTITRRLQQLDIDYEIVNAGRDGPHQVIVGTVGDSGPTLYLHGHYDVVPAFSDGQFDPRVEHGRIYGRGAADMKGALAAMIYAAVLHRDGGQSGRVKLIFVPDEETGGADGAERLSELGVIDPIDAAGAIVCEPSWPTVWHASRGAFTLRVTVHGKPAHVGLHYEGVNAFEILHRAVDHLRVYRDQIAQRCTALAIEPEAARSSIMLLGGLSGGGTNFNIVPHEAWFTIDRRPNADEDFPAARAELLGLLDALRREGLALDWEILQDAAPSFTLPNHPFVDTMEQLIASACGKNPTITMCPGCLENRVYSRLGIPVVAYGPGTPGSMHAPDEYVEIEHLVTTCAVYAATLGSIVSTPNP